MPFLTSLESDSIDGGVNRWRFVLRPDEPCFAGHFDDAPVLPGIAHVAIAVEACGQLRPSGGAPVALDDVRFMRPLAPGDACEITVTLGPGSARFAISCDGAVASSGRLTFSDPRP